MSIYLAKLANKVSNQVAERDHPMHPTRHEGLYVKKIKAASLGLSALQ